MRFTLLPFQDKTSAKATEEIRLSMAEVARLGVDGDGQAITLSAPTGAGKDRDGRSGARGVTAITEIPHF